VIARSFSVFLAWEIRLLTLLDEPLVFRNPPFGFCLGIEFAEVTRNGVRPRYFDAPFAAFRYYRR
jgi:hypothetical protein